ncbi:MAG: CopG family transcriptional regulator [bacterium]
MMVYTLEVAMVRTQIYLTRQERAGLATLAETTGMKLSELIREAVNRLIAQSGPDRKEAVLSAAAGLWKDRKDLPDFAATRAEWDRSKA